MGRSVRPKNLKKCMRLNRNFQELGGLRKIPSVGEVWIFSGIIHSKIGPKTLLGS